MKSRNFNKSWRMALEYSKWLISLLLLAAACGKGDDKAPASSPELAPTDRSSSDESAPGSSVPSSGLAVPDTSMEGLTAVVSDRQVSIRLRVLPAMAATFECALGPELFQPCQQTVTLTNLAHGKTYQFRARARTASGIIDPRPASAEFFVDLRSSGRSAPRVAVQAHDLPGSKVEDPTAATAQIAARVLQLGSGFSIDVPPEFGVASFSTDQTYNNRLLTFRRLEVLAGYDNVDRTCGRVYERQVAVGQRSYCEGTPTRQQLASDFPGALPYNHIELIQPGAQGIGARLLVATPAENDPAAGKLTIAPLCTGAVRRGNNQAPIAAGFYTGDVLQGQLVWCQVRDRQTSVYWWVAQVNAGQGLELVYMIESALVPTVLNGQAFVIHTSGMLTQTLKALTP
jgi:hypothetical protein